MTRRAAAEVGAWSCVVLLSSAAAMPGNDAPRVSLQPVRCEEVHRLRLDPWGSWSRVGHRLVLMDGHHGIRVLDVDRPHAHVDMVSAVPRGAKVVDWSPDGNWLLYVERVVTGTWADREDRLGAASIRDGRKIAIADVPSAWPAFWAADGTVWWWDGASWRSRRPLAGFHGLGAAAAETLLVGVFDEDRQMYRIQRFDSPAGSSIDLVGQARRPVRANVHGELTIVTGLHHGLIDHAGHDVTPAGWKHLPFFPHEVSTQAGLIYGRGPEVDPGAHSTRHGDEEPEEVDSGFVGAVDGSWWQKIPELGGAPAQLSPDGRFIAGEDTSGVLRVFELRALHRKPLSHGREP